MQEIIFNCPMEGHHTNCGKIEASTGMKSLLRELTKLLSWKYCRILLTFLGHLFPFLPPLIVYFWKFEGFSSISHALARIYRILLHFLRSAASFSSFNSEQNQQNILNWWIFLSSPPKMMCRKAGNLRSIYVKCYKVVSDPPKVKFIGLIWWSD